MFMCTVQCYTPSGGPSCRTQGFCHSYPALVACRQQGLLFCLLLGFQSVVPSGVAGCRPSGLSTARTIFCLLLGSASLVSHGRCQPNKDSFFGFYLVFGLCTVMKQRLVFRVLVGLVRICTANSRVLLYGV